MRTIRWLFIAGLVATVAVAAFGWFVRHAQIEQAAPRIVTAPADLPTIDVGLVLGTGPLTHWRDGHVTPNLPFVLRLDAAAALWRAGKVKYLVASGNRTGDYDEPTPMRAGLIERGVPADVIYRDFAGFRTIDSILRAHTIYGLKRLVIVSQRAHLERAIFLARAAGMDAWGLAAGEEQPGGPKFLDRVFLTGAALLAWWDVTVDTLPRERGPPVVIGVDPAR
jgi:SanA protein